VCERNLKELDYQALNVLLISFQSLSTCSLLGALGKRRQRCGQSRNPMRGDHQRPEPAAMIFPATALQRPSYSTLDGVNHQISTGTLVAQVNNNNKTSLQSQHPHPHPSHSPKRLRKTSGKTSKISKYITARTPPTNRNLALARTMSL
jgi:hypothetical protein